MTERNLMIRPKSGLRLRVADLLYPVPSHSLDVTLLLRVSNVLPRLRTPIYNMRTRIHRQPQNTRRLLRTILMIHHMPVLFNSLLKAMRPMQQPMAQYLQ